MAANKNTNKVSILQLFMDNKALFLLVIAFVSSIIATGGNTLGSYNLTSLMRQIPVYAIMAMGYTILFTSGQFDMSAGAVLSLCTIVYASLSLKAPLAVAIICCILVGILCEFTNGVVIRLFNLNGFVLTLATSEIIQGISGQITAGKNVSGLSDKTKYLGKQLIWGTVPLSFVVAIIVIIIVSFVIYRTLYGRHLVATGGNQEAAKVSGIKTAHIRVSAFALLGVCAGIGAILLTGRLGLGSMNAGNDYSLDCIAGVVIGGTSQHGGKPKVSGSLFGMGLIIVINNMLDLLGTGTYLKMVAKGMIIVIAIVLDSLSEKYAAAQRVKGS